MSLETIDSDECAKLMHCTSDHIEELARKGEIPALKIGRGWLFVRGDLLAYLSEKARAEALERRAKCHPSAKVTDISRRRRRPIPALPQPLR